VKNVHKGEYPPKFNEEDQSLSEMNEENRQENSHQDKSEPTNDQSGRYLHSYFVKDFPLVLFSYDC
jgi:hypothetical protein